MQNLYYILFSTISYVYLTYGCFFCGIKCLCIGVFMKIKIQPTITIRCLSGIFLLDIGNNFSHDRTLFIPYTKYSQ